MLVAWRVFSIMAAALTASCGGAPVVAGRLSYELRELKVGHATPGPLQTAPAAGVALRVRAGGRVLARGVTGRDGRYAAALDAPLPPGATVEFSAVLLDKAGRPDAGIAHADGDERAASAFWRWSFPATTHGPVVRIADGSGALHLFRSLVFVLSWAPRFFTPVARPQSLVIFWAPRVPYICVACFEDRHGGGVTVGGQRFDAAIWLDGATSLAQVWSEGVINHELGHWVMATFGSLPDDNRQHGLIERIPAQTAWLEGFATFFAQAALSARERRELPWSIAVADHVTYALDLATGAYDDESAPGEHLADIIPAWGEAQDIAEGAVARILWALRGALGDAAIVGAIAAPRLTGKLDRGASGKDLVDFLDALLCGHDERRARVQKIVRGLDFPYSEPKCP